MAASVSHGISLERSRSEFLNDEGPDLDLDPALRICLHVPIQLDLYASKSLAKQMECRASRICFHASVPPNAWGSYTRTCELVYYLFSLVLFSEHRAVRKKPLKAIKQPTLYHCILIIEFNFSCCFIFIFVSTIKNTYLMLSSSQLVSTLVHFSGNINLFSQLHPYFLSAVSVQWKRILTPQLAPPPRAAAAGWMERKSK